MTDIEHARLSSLIGFQDRVAAWMRKAIPDATFAGQIEKLKQELFELKCEASKENPHLIKLITEACDVFWVATVLCQLRGIQIAHVLEAKAVKNESRVWEQTSQGVYQHKEPA
jgi:phosphoribosyl-ATP pyrophosphohydrolase